MNLPGPAALLYYELLSSAVILIAIIVVRPAVTAHRGGKIFAFLALFIFPASVRVWRGIGTYRAFQANDILPFLPHHGALRKKSLCR